MMSSSLCMFSSIPTYDGSVTMYSSPIVGLEEYRNSMSTLSKLIAA